MSVKNRVIETNDLPEDVLLRCDGVGVCYRKPYKLGQSHDRKDREFWPFCDLNLELKRGETLGVVGRNGVGKSTLLRMLAGVIHPDFGHINMRPKLKVQLLSDNLGFERILSGRENAVMAGMLLGLSRLEVENSMGAIKEFSELGDFFEQPVYSYSSGMIARLGFSIAIEAKPDVLLLDEILAVGDEAFREKSYMASLKLIQSGKSVIIVMHDSSLIEKTCDRIVKL